MNKSVTLARSCLRAVKRHAHYDSVVRRSAQESQREFIMSILQANPSARDSKFYLKAFAPKQVFRTGLRNGPGSEIPVEAEPAESDGDAIKQHTAIVKVQGPFTDRQLRSVAEGLVYLRRLGLLAIIVVDLEDWSPSHRNARQRMLDEVLRLSDMLEEAGGSARPLLEPVLIKRGDDYNIDSLQSLSSAVEYGEIPILPPLALSEENSISMLITPNQLMQGLAIGLANYKPPSRSYAHGRYKVDLTPYRLMVINREGGIPSHARGGTPHLAINLESEYDNINQTYLPEWHKSHPTSLDNLACIRACLKELPRTSQAIIVSHRSPKALIANLITSRPAHSPSLHASHLPPLSKLQQIPTLIRHGLPITVHRNLDDINLDALTRLLETAFRRTLKKEAYFDRLRKSLDFIIVAGDCAACAIVTREGSPDGPPIAYLDKFAVLPSLQGDGTVDFLWGALRDESFGLGLLDALNNNGGLEGKGQPVDLVWRSRSDNLVNKWYFERSNGFATLGPMGNGGTNGLLFWCDAEKRVEQLMRASGGEGASFVTDDELGRLSHWKQVIGAIPSCWA